MEKLGDGNGIYIRGAGAGNVIRRNYVHHLVAPMHMQAAIRTDGGQRIEEEEDWHDPKMPTPITISTSVQVIPSWAERCYRNSGAMEWILTAKLSIRCLWMRKTAISDSSRTRLRENWESLESTSWKSACETRHVLETYDQRAVTTLRAIYPLE
jgi:hypothetical protein